MESNIIGFYNILEACRYSYEAYRGVEHLVYASSSSVYGGKKKVPLPPYAVYNIGGGTPENLLDFVSTLQEELVRAGILPADYDFDANRELVGMQPGDVPITYADSRALEADYGFRPTIDIRTGLRRFAEWYKEYYKD